jgi:hypothetical protein
VTRPRLANQRHLFEIPDDLVYLDCASQAPQLHSIRLAGERALARSASPWTIGDKDWFDEVEELRELFSRLIGADPDGIALIPATSYGLAVFGEEQRSGRPIEENWSNRVDAEDAARLADYSDRYRPGARRFDVGQRSNFTLVPMAIAALRQLGEWGVGNISGFGMPPPLPPRWRPAGA